MSPSVVAVRQNLDLIVDNGPPVPGLDANDNHRWGATLGGRVQVWRSGLGVTADGALVYVGGRACPSSTWPTCWPGPGPSGPWRWTSTPPGSTSPASTPPVGQPASAANGTLLTYDEQTYPARYFKPCPGTS